MAAAACGGNGVSMAAISQRRMAAGVINGNILAAHQRGVIAQWRGEMAWQISMAMARKWRQWRINGNRLMALLA